MSCLGGIKSDTASPETTGEPSIPGEQPAPSNVPGSSSPAPLNTPATPVSGLPPCANCRKQIAGKRLLFC